MKFVDYGEEFKDGDIIGTYLDKYEGKIGFTKNGKDLGIAFSIDINSPLYPTICIKSGSLSMNFGATPFEYPPPDPSYNDIENADPTNVFITEIKSIV